MSLTFYLLTGAAAIGLTPWVLYERRKNNALPVPSAPSGEVGVTHLLENNGIATPHQVLLDLIRLKIAALPNDCRKWWTSGEYLSLEFKMKSGRQLLISHYYRPHGHGAWGYLHVDDLRVTVGMPGGGEWGPYLSVELSVDEQLVLHKEIMALSKRTRAHQKAVDESKSQHAALNIVEEMIK